MLTFRKIMTSAISLLCCVTILSAVIIAPSFRMESEYYDDKELREQVSGSIDFIILGASHALSAFDPRTIDEAIDCNSYNLSGSMMTSYSKLYMLKKELARNPVNTVVFEISFDTFCRNEKQEYGVGDAYTIERLDSFPERLFFMLKYLSLEDWLNIYSREMTEGIYCWKRMLSGNTTSMVDYSAKGFHKTTSADITLPPAEVKESFAKRPISIDYYQDAVEMMTEAIELCQANGINVIVCVSPVSDRLIWSRSEWDNFSLWLDAFCTENNCACYDFNLLRNRYEIFNDSMSFHDEGHLSESGAKAFSQEFGRVIKKAQEGEAVSQYFYRSYTEMIQDSPYMEYYHNLNIGFSDTAAKSVVFRARCQPWLGYEHS